MSGAIPATTLLYFLGVFGHSCTKTAVVRGLSGGTCLVLAIFRVNFSVYFSVSNFACVHRVRPRGSNLLGFTDPVRNRRKLSPFSMGLAPALPWICAEPSKKHQKVQIHHKGVCRIPPSPIFRQAASPSKGLWTFSKTHHTTAEGKNNFRIFLYISSKTD